MQGKTASSPVHEYPAAGRTQPHKSSAAVQPEVAIYRLLGVPGLSDAALCRLLSSWREEPALTESFWGRATDEYRARWGLAERAAVFLQDDGEAEDLCAAAEGAARNAHQAEIELLTSLDPAYARLAAGRGLPPVLFSRGNQDLLWGNHVAVVHSRDAPEQALGWGAALAGLLAQEGVGFVTGHNRDGYRRVAAAAKQQATPMVIVLDRPLHGAPADGPRAEPVATARLWDPQFRPERQLVLSPFRPREGWTPRHARRRDALIIASAAVVVAGGVRAGGTLDALCAARIAAGRPVLRSPYCRAEMGAETLPAAVPAATVEVCHCVRDAVERGEAARSSLCPVPGWVARRWEQEVCDFLDALKHGTGRPIQARRFRAQEIAGADPGERQTWLQCVRAMIRIPAADSSQEMGLIILGDPPGTGAEAPDVLLLAPGEPVVSLTALRQYLSRCQAQALEALRNRRR